MTESLVDAAWRTQAIHRGAPAQRMGRNNPDPPAWVDAMSNEEFGQMLGPSWANMTPRQRRLYPDGLSQREKDVLWNYLAERHHA